MGVSTTSARWCSYVWAVVIWVWTAAMAEAIREVYSVVLAPNMSSCHLPLNLPAAEAPFDCCAPRASYEPRLFRPDELPSGSGIRVRRPAHAANETYAQKLARAYELMRALPDDDPRSFHQQANIHCAYCNTVYNQLFSSQLFQVHGSWLFFPFHRWYLYFHERILARLLGDDLSFALSFWNNDHPDGASMPPIFTSGRYPSLLNPLRDPFHQPPSVVAIDYTLDTDGRPADLQLQDNNNAMYRSMIRAPLSQYRFFGFPLRPGQSAASAGYGTIERQPHNSVHLWTGSRWQVGMRDMGSFYAAARDPIFYAHHALIDRLWEVWKALRPGINRDIDDPDYLDAEFVFYNEDAEMVRVRVGDALNTTMLGYVYEEVEKPWVDAVPVRLSRGLATIGPDDEVCVAGQPIMSPCSVVVWRDPQRATLEGVEEDVALLGVGWEEGLACHANVYVNLPSANASTTSGCVEYVGFFMMVPQFTVGVNVTSETYEIGSIIRQLGLAGEPSVVITIVPRRSVDSISSPISVSNITIDYISSPSASLLTSPSQVQ